MDKDIRRIERGASRVKPARINAVAAAILTIRLPDNEISTSIEANDLRLALLGDAVGTDRLVSGDRVQAAVETPRGDGPVRVVRRSVNKDEKEVAIREL